ncbi:MAG: hypothetical protein IKT56_04585 [Clostridia bacterium]|nr:hypothetical protein [Clostridia bacterium]
MKNKIKKLWDAICSPFIAMACFIDECKLANEDGSWDTYWAKKNKRNRRKDNV